MLIHSAQTPTKSFHAGRILSVPPSRQTLMTLAEFNRMHLCTTVMPQRTIGSVRTDEKCLLRPVLILGQLTQDPWSLHRGMMAHVSSSLRITLALRYLAPVTSTTELSTLH